MLLKGALSAGRVGTRSYSTTTKVTTSIYVNSRTTTLAVKPVPPVFQEKNGWWNMKRKGSIILDFATQADKSVPTFNDWAKKLSFGLAPMEIGKLATTPPGEVMEFVHTFSSGVGDRMDEKILRVAANSDGEGVTFTIVYNPADGESREMSVPVRDSEFFVLKNLLYSSIPQLCGWNYSLGATPFDPSAVRVEQDTFRGSSEFPAGGQR